MGSRWQSPVAGAKRSRDDDEEEERAAKTSRYDED